ncbi:endoribonuclease L-PSP, partial [Dactylonectria macrodidyma]
ISDLKYFSYDGFGKFALDNYGYNQAVRVGDRIEISGQGGWDPDSAPAFFNIDHAMKSAGGKRMSQVFRITSYHPNLRSEALGSVKENLERWFPNYKPIWTAVGVEKLVFEEMLVEIETIAYDPQGT